MPSGIVGNGSGSGADAGPAPTFHQVFADVISTKCVACHVPGGIGVTTGGLDMSSESVAYGNLVGKDASGTSCSRKGILVVPNEPDSSLFYLKVSLDDPSPCGAKMPLSTAPLSQAQADEIENWIKGGALN